MGEWRYSPTILDLCSRWRLAVSFAVLIRWMKNDWYGMDVFTGWKD
jgi:hypothetical protein